MSEDFMKMLEAEAERLASYLPNETELANIAELAKRQIHLENLLVQLEDLKEKAKESLKRVSEKALPEAILATGLSEFKLEDGTRVSVKKAYYPSVKDENKHEAYTWLVENGYDIIKSEVKLSFTKNESPKAAAAVKALTELGFDPSKSDSIHWQTFRAWAKEVMEKGVEIPETINLYIVDQASIKRSK